ncbi:MAG: SGNH/GDSL hydrolase family protein [Oscillospiraceae bacterium]|jgi:lysophospholipase L1-like esterase|nr:SGNH/GDSL hydrolase family protein [Oscillospiraceae bacterium]
MNIIKHIAVFGDSIFKGMQLDPKTLHYRIVNNIDIDLISRTHSLVVSNYAKIGSTITKGMEILQKRLATDEVFDVAIMDYGGNDCDFDWAQVAETPDAEHTAHTPLDAFVATYHRMIDLLRERGIRPILATLPPIDPQKFFDWNCRGLNKENVLRWLGEVTTIYRFQEMYSRTVEKIAAEAGCLLVDLRGAFLAHRRIDNLLCEDGTHPNTEGQKVITEAFLDFAGRYAPA